MSATVPARSTPPPEPHNSATVAGSTGNDAVARRKEAPSAARPATASSVPVATSSRRRAVVGFVAVINVILLVAGFFGSEKLPSWPSVSGGDLVPAPEATLDGETSPAVLGWTSVAPTMTPLVTTSSVAVPGEEFPTSDGPTAASTMTTTTNSNGERNVTTLAPRAAVVLRSHDFEAAVAAKVAIPWPPVAIRKLRPVPSATDGCVDPSAAAGMMSWAPHQCNPMSKTASLDAEAKRRFTAMPNVSADCLFFATGLFRRPLDKGTLDRDAARLAGLSSAGSASTGNQGCARKPWCTETQLRRWDSSFGWVARKATAAPSDGSTSASSSYSSSHRSGENDTASFFNFSLRFPAPLESLRLRHRECRLPDTSNPYELLVLLRASWRRAQAFSDAAMEASSAKKKQKRSSAAPGPNATDDGIPTPLHPTITFAGDSIHRNMMASFIAMLRGQTRTVVDRQTHGFAHYVLTTHGDRWVTFGAKTKKRFSQATEEVPGEVLLEVFFSPRLGGVGTHTTLTPLIRRPTTHLAIIAGGLVHVERSCPFRFGSMSSLSNFAGYAAKYAGELRPAWQTLILREPTAVRSKSRGLGAFDQWKRHQYDTALASAVHRDDNNRRLRHRQGLGDSSGGLGLFTLSSLGHGDDARDAGGRVGNASSSAGGTAVVDAARNGQAVHPVLTPLDHVHHVCIAKGLAKPTVMWPFLPAECGAWHERGQLEMALGMIFAHARTLPLPASDSSRRQRVGNSSSGSDRLVNTSGTDNATDTTLDPGEV